MADEPTEPTTGGPGGAKRSLAIRCLIASWIQESFQVQVRFPLTEIVANPGSLKEPEVVEPECEDRANWVPRCLGGPEMGAAAEVTASRWPSALFPAIGFFAQQRISGVFPFAPVPEDGNPLLNMTALGAPQPDSNPSDTYLMHTFVLADDHGVVRQSLKKLLTQESDLHLVGETGDGLEVLKLVEKLEPDVLVTDLMMPGLNGLEVIRRVRQASPETRIIAVSVNSDDPYVEGAFTCGADAYVLKASCGKHLIPAVRAALGGERYISPPLAGATV